jgi:hypothetical protein
MGKGRYGFWMVALLLVPLMMGCAKEGPKEEEVKEGKIVGKAFLSDQIGASSPDHSGIVVEIKELGMSTQSSKEGSFGFEKVPEGIYLLRFSKEGYQVAEQFVEVTAGGTATVPEITLQATGSIVGKVLLEGQADHKGTKVVVVELGVEATTDREGNFSIRGIPVGTYTLKVQHSGYMEDLWKGVVVEPLKETDLGEKMLKSGLIGLGEDGDMKGWDSWAGANNVQLIGYSNGILSLRITGPDPFFFFKVAWSQDRPLKIDASKYKYVSVKMRNTSGDTRAQIYWASDLDPNWSEANHHDFDIISDGEWHVYLIDLRNNPKWSGTITNLRFDPAANASNGDVEIDWIAVIEKPI